MSEKIIVKIDALGNPTVEAEGFQGVACEDATRPIEEILSGAGGVTKEFKPEWAQEAHLTLEQGF